MRQIKFRAWDGLTMVYPSIEGHGKINSGWIISNYETVMQFTGLKDKNGKEIYPNDLLRVKGTMGETSQYKFDCIYRVNEINLDGLSLSFVKLFSEEPDSIENSYPINMHPSFRYNSLCTDYLYGNYDNIAFSETHGDNPTFRTTWKEHDYTNDIEVIGNIYENSDLLAGRGSFI